MEHNNVPPRWPNVSAEASHGQDTDEMVAQLGTIQKVVVNPGYDELAIVLYEALEQAQLGKGHERHGSGLPFMEQPMQTFSTMLGSMDGMAFQVMKKVNEARNLPLLAQRKRELLGVIVYAAGMILFDSKRNKD